jgi:PAS domain S-box-containing protein
MRTDLNSVSDATTEAASEQQNRLFDAILNNTRMLVACLDREFNFVVVNRAYAEADDHEPEFFPGKNHFALYPNEENVAIFRRVVETGEPYFCHARPFQYQEHPKRGTSYWDWSLMPIKDPSGEVVRLVLTLTDVTSHHKAQDELQKTVRRVELLSGVTSQLLASDRPQEIVESLCRDVLEHLDCHVFFNYLLDECQGRLHLNACGGISPEVVQTIEWLGLGTTVCGCVARDCCRILAENIQTIPDPRTDLVRSFGTQAYACHPLLNQGQVIGTLSFGSRTKTTFGEDELRLMKAVADQVAIAMQRLRLVESLEHRVAERTAEAEQRATQLRAMAAELAEAEQRERRRLAQVLHDHLQQLLVAAKMKVGRVHRRTDDPSLARIIAEVDELLDQSIAESRSLTVELSPPVLYDAGLAAGLQWLGRQMEEKHGLPIVVQADPTADPSEESTRVFLFQAARELLFNVVKHARAEVAWVCLSKTDEQQVCIEVADNGVGVDPERLNAPTDSHDGFGLFNVRERLKLLGGRLEVAAGADGGTRITIVVPQTQPTDSPPGSSPADGDGTARRPSMASVPNRRVASGKLRVLVADDHPIVRKGLADLLREQPGIEVVVEARDGQEAVERARETSPDVVVMDINMPRLSGIEATRCIKEDSPHVVVIGLSMHEEDDMGQAIREAGATAYFRKDTPAEVLIPAILGPFGG